MERNKMPSTQLVLPDIQSHDREKGKHLGGLPNMKEEVQNGADAVDALVSSWNVRVPLALNNKAYEVNKRTCEAIGRTLDTVSLYDLIGRPDVKKDIATLRLNEYFDDRGSPRLRRLGLTFAAKHNPVVSSAFGSQGDLPASERDRRTTASCSAKAMLLATVAKDRDLEYGKKQIAAVCESLTGSERHKVQDVLERQIEVVFSEIQSFKNYIPQGVRHSDLLPLDVDREEEMRYRRAADRANSLLLEKSWQMGKQMGWMFSASEVKVLLQVVSLWMRATRGPGCTIGIDRPTFCRLILDLGLVDQQKVPLFWAVSLFDTVAKPMHVNAADGALTMSQPLVSMASQWHLMQVLDTIMRRNFDITAKRDFMASLFHIARFRLPAFVIEESGLEMDKLVDAMNNRDQDLTSPLSGTSDGISDDDSNVDGHTPDTQVIKKAEGRNNEQEEHMNDQLTHCMLVEPEVLHLVTQFQGVFQQLHACYADEGGNMAFQKFQQFCVDFHLTPALVSSHFLKNAYTGAQCVESPELSIRSREKRQAKGKMSHHTREKGKAALVRGLKTGDLEKAVKSLDAKDKATASGKQEPKKLSARAKTDSHLYSKEISKPKSGPQPWVSIACRAAEAVSKAAAKETPEKEAVSEKGPVIFYGGARRTITDSELRLLRQTAQVKAVPPANSGLTSPAPSFSGEKRPSLGARSITSPSPAPSGHERQVSSRRTLVSTAAPDGGDPRTQRRVTMRARSEGLQPTPPPEPPHRPQLQSKFGAGAFVETLCRIAFSYLGTYGNTPQQQTNGYVRICWLMTYLHFVFVHLKTSFEKRSRDEVHESLSKALQSINAKLLAVPPLPTKGLLPLPVMREGLPKMGHDSPARRKTTIVKPPPTLPKRAGSKLTAVNALTPRRPSKRLSRRSSNETSEPAVDPEPAKMQEVSLPPCVVDGSCRVCSGSTAQTKWGNPRCHGCSIVDRLGFEHHLFKQLLLDFPESKRPIAPSAQWPCKTTRPVLTPPPMRDCHSLRA